MYYSDPMEQDDVYDDIEATQAATQQVNQPATQPTENARDLWGFLIPCNLKVTRIDLWKGYQTCNFGRGSENTFVFPSLKISNKHCSISWDGVENPDSIVTVLDMSSNGTFINGHRIGKGRTSILREGNEIAFGSWGPTSGEDDYRYIFRFTAAGPPREGLYKYYDIGNELGKGTFATVMRAVSRQTGQTYAVKMIHRSRFKTKGPASQHLFLREISILRDLDHVNICRLKETFQEEETINLVLEYVNGGDLLDHILLYQGLAEDHARYLTAQLCEALAYIHSKGIAHRDLKPENVLLTKDNPPIVKVADFGLAKAVDSMTMFKTTCGTPAYLAPEVILRESNKGYDHLVDSWSVGVIVFSMLTNASPFDEDNDEEADIQTKFRRRLVHWETLDAFNLSPEGRDFIERLLENEPGSRMSLTQALSHPWLLPLTAHLAYPSPADSLTPSNGGSIIDDSQQLIQHPQSNHATTSQGYEKINAEEAVTPRFPGAFPASQGLSQGASSVGRTPKPLNRRVADLNERDPEGKFQSWELVTPEEGQLGRPVDAAEAGGSGGGKGKGAKNGAARLQEVTPYLEGDSDSSLTPISEDDGGATVQPGPVSPNGRGKNKVAAAKRTTRRAARDVEDMGGEGDMEVETAQVVQGRRRQPPRGASGTPHKRT